MAAPVDPLKSGSPASLIGWQGLGAEGRNRVLGGPDAAAIAALRGQPAQEPLRVFVGLNNADTPKARAALALAELRRIGAFDRAVLVIATPTGTGWVDPAAMQPVEYLMQGDIASVSVQYSYLPSWLSLLVEPEYGAETAQAVFRAVYGHWTGLPKDTRPKLYLFGLSLGSLNSDLSADIYDVLGDPYQGALWAGPPFASRTWPQITAGRAAGSPAWAPRFRDGSLVRFTTQTDHTAEADASWGPIRIVYLQYASDPIVFFSPATLWRRPDWMVAPRGPDVSPSLAWVPVVTFFQLVFDMMTATSTPAGYGHVYAAGDYLTGWLAVTAPEGWTAPELDRLRAELRAQGL
ncbi:alpha/beta-hydrolase family protein [Gemmobacter fulvus]|uniref:Alpha/beta-hydrolase family protein n=2 Tax=Gemmobacter fulvus TaxID=2840474 RepID=A0A975S2Z7_9RHOB|nr:alpha/beta-hydrolase family protein [Gemmobacter fulvus]QWK91941.1 alpha/beta-hydrolase family protein [Gemmobacter fulvus]